MLTEKYNALVVTDDCHDAGFIGKTGRGIHEHCEVMDKVDIITGTLGKSLGSSSGRFTSGKKEIIEYYVIDLDLIFSSVLWLLQLLEPPLQSFH